MSNLFKKALLILIIVMSLATSNRVKVNAEDKPAEYCYTDVNGEEKCYPTLPEQECVIGTGCDGTAPSINGAGVSFQNQMLLSFNAKIAEKEKLERFITQLDASALTARKDVNVGIFSGGEAFGVFIFGSLQDLIEQGNLFVSRVVITFYNVATGGLIQNIVGGALATVNKTVFDWGNINGFGFGIVIILALITIMSRVFQMLTNYQSRQYIVKSIVSVIVGALMLLFVVNYGAPIVNQIRTNIDTSIASLNGNELSTSTENKNNMFDILQRQPFLIRNFNVGADSQIIIKENNHEIENGTQAVDLLLEDVGGNYKKVQSITDQLRVQEKAHQSISGVVDSLGMTVYRTGIATTFLFFSLILLLFEATLQLQLGLAAFAIGEFLQDGTFNAMKWILNKLSMAMMIVLVNVFLGILIKSLISIITAFVAIHPGLLIIVATIAVFLSYKLFKNVDVLIAKSRELLSKVSNMNYGAKDMIIETKDAVVKASKITADKVEKLKANIDNSELKANKNSTTDESIKDTESKQLAGSSNQNLGDELDSNKEPKIHDYRDFSNENDGDDSTDEEIEDDLDRVEDHDSTEDDKSIDITDSNIKHDDTEEDTNVDEVKSELPNQSDLEDDLDEPDIDHVNLDKETDDNLKSTKEDVNVIVSKDSKNEHDDKVEPKETESNYNEDNQKQEENEQVNNEPPSKEQDLESNDNTFNDKFDLQFTDESFDWSIENLEKFLEKNEGDDNND